MMKYESNSCDLQTLSYVMDLMHPLLTLSNETPSHLFIHPFIDSLETLGFLCSIMDICELCPLLVHLNHSKHRNAFYD